MKSRDIKQFIRNRLLFALPIVTGLVYGAWRFAIGSNSSPRYGSNRHTNTGSISIPPQAAFIIYLAAAVLFPLLITATVLYFILREAKVVSSVDYLTYIDQTTLKEFQWSEDAIGHLVGSAERSRVSRIKEVSEAAVDRTDGFRAVPIAEPRLHDELSDLPQYDPNGPSPFKK